MMYDKYNGLPDPGSLLEKLFILVRMRRDRITLLQTFTVAQTIRDDDTGEASAEAFEKFKVAVLPYLSGEEKQAKFDMAEAMRAEFARGPMKIQALAPTNQVKSRLQNVVRGLKQPHIGWRGK